MSIIVLGTKEEESLERNSINDATAQDWDSAFARQDPVLPIGSASDLKSDVTPDSILNQAMSEMQDRATTYDSPEGERSMSNTVEAFNLLTGEKMSTSDGWLFMALLKLVRANQGDFRLDSFVDGAAYIALYGSEKSLEEK